MRITRTDILPTGAFIYMVQLDNDSRKSFVGREDAWFTYPEFTRIQGHVSRALSTAWHRDTMIGDKNV